MIADSLAHGDWEPDNIRDINAKLQRGRGVPGIFLPGGAPVLGFVPRTTQTNWLEYATAPAITGGYCAVITLSRSEINPR